MQILRRWDQRYWLALLAVMIAGLLLHSMFWSTPASELMGEDIFYIWLEGKRIVMGENPYARILAGDMRVNDKYATYFPLAYLFSALTQKLGLLEFSGWLYLWRPLSYLFHMGIVALVWRYFYIRRLAILGLAAALILVGGRWSIYVVRVHHLEFAAIFFLLLSLVLLDRQKKLGLLAFGLSLSIKQIAIFLLPLYLIHLWLNNQNDKHRVRDLGLNLLTILSIPLLTSLPFLIWNAEGFFRSILFSATRLGSLHIDGAPSLDVIAAQRFAWMVGFKAKLPMLLPMAIIYLSCWREKTSLLVSSAMVMMVFLYFNSVLFLQYFLWPLCLILVALVEQVPIASPRSQG